MSLTAKKTSEEYLDLDEEYFVSDMEINIDDIFRKLRKMRFDNIRSEEELMVNINVLKNYHNMLASLYNLRVVDRVSLLSNFYRSKWGNRLVGYTYDIEFNSLDPSVMKLLTSAMIAERFILAKRRLLKHMTISIVGLKGSGKTTLSVSSAIQGLRMAELMRIDEQEAINTVMASTFFEPESFVNFVRYELLENERWYPIIILDDIGAQISKYWLHVGEKWWSYLFSVLDHLKDWCGVLIMTATSLKAIPARLREITDLVVRSMETNVGSYVMDVFTFYLSEEYSKKSKPIYIDVAPPTLKMPDELWKRMRETRREIGIVRLERVLSALKEAKDRLESAKPKETIEEFEDEEYG